MADALAISDRRIADIAEALATIYRVYSWEWADPDTRELYAPESSDIALAIKAKVADLKPGMRLESGRLIVEWLEEDGQPMEIRVLVHHGDLLLPGEAHG